VRQKVLQVWARLVEAGCVPLSHWNTLLAQGVLVWVLVPLPCACVLGGCYVRCAHGMHTGTL
jgi:hypothetical protein